ncbi:aromatic compound dioxygenase [Exidia glandulosa HHB12029]|uniref:Aromatic compound dioxygenase n=1 Tax=Exidia glandulosa HHB12029 TaxID=1314781 RepID=A0A165KU10_EXIGL|nr:aromatic compound dioxygenase [Exidia glandulosa HHB12029]
MAHTLSAEQLLGTALRAQLANGSIPKHTALDKDVSELGDYTVTDQIIDLHNANCKDPRRTFVVNSLVKHLHAFIRETMLTETEFTAALKFIDQAVKAGDIGGFSEMYVAGASLGVLTLLDELHNPRPKGSTLGALEGPFFIRENVPVLPSGSSICSSETVGEKMFFSGTVRNMQGRPIKGALIDIWQADGDGLYDVQYKKGADDRARITAKDDGTFTFRGVMPTAYGLPDVGPTTELLSSLGRHPYRATHIHFQLAAPGYQDLITQLSPSNALFLADDSVFATKRDLIADVSEDTNPSNWGTMGFNEAEVRKAGGRVWVWKFDFVLPTPDECEAAKKQLKEKLATRV